MVIAARKPVHGVIHHSGQVVQYAANEYSSKLRKYGFAISMSRSGNPYDNATMESFFKTLKYEEVYLCEYNTCEDVLEKIPYFLILSKQSIIRKDFIQGLAILLLRSTNNGCY